MKKFFMSVVAYILVCCGVSAAPIDESKALKIAGEFFAKKASSGASSMRVCHKVSGAGTKEKVVEKNNLFYVINRGDDKGYVIIAGDDRVPSILAYSDKGVFTKESLQYNHSLGWILEQYEVQIQWAIENLPDRPSKKTMRKVRDEDIIIRPLLEFDNDRATRLRTPISWGQDWPFNAFTPIFHDPQWGRFPVRTAAGCVATAIATVMRWHKWPEKPGGSVRYMWNGNELSLDWDGDGPENAPYDWTQMPAGITARGINRETNAAVTDVQANNIGRLLRDVGYAVNMNYGPVDGRGSGAQVANWTVPAVQNFGYTEGIERIQRAFYTPEDWWNEINGELSDNGPIVYVGFSRFGSGHCFVIDGIANGNFVHVDWGWNGMSNGWFQLDVLNPENQGIGGGVGGYGLMQHMIRNMRPNRNNNNDNVNPEPVVENGENLYVQGTNPLREVFKANDQEITVSLGNRNREADFNGQLALYIQRDGDAQPTLAATLNTVLEANARREVTFRANLAERETGVYLLTVGYARDNEYQMMDRLAGRIRIVENNNPNPGVNPNVDRDNLAFALSVPTYVNVELAAGENSKIELGIRNAGNLKYEDDLNLYALPSNRTNMAYATLISSGHVNLIENQTATITFYTNDAFNALSEGTYNLILKYNKNNVSQEMLITNSNRNRIGAMTILKKELPASAGDVSFYTAYLYQNNQRVGSDYATVNKYGSNDITVRYYLYSQKGFNGKVKAFVANSYYGTSAYRSAMEKTIDVRVEAGKYAYMDVTYPTSDFSAYTYYLKLAAQTGNANAWETDEESVPFYVSYRNYYYYANDSGAGTGNNRFLWGPTFIVDETNDNSKYLYQSVGNDIEIWIDVSNVTGIDEINADRQGKTATFNLNGQRVGENYRGLVIENGKKVIRK